MRFFPSDVPDAPLNPAVKDVERRAVTLKWKAPAHDGGSPVTGYMIEYRVSGHFRWEVANHGDPVPDQRYTVRNLRDEESYEFRIAAVNKAGTGPFAPIDMVVAVKEPIGEKTISAFEPFQHSLRNREKQSSHHYLTI